MAKKLCSKCKRWKQPRCFYKQARSKDGLMGRCKQCFLEAQETAAARRKGEDRPLRVLGSARAGKTVLPPQEVFTWKDLAACRDQPGDWVEIAAKAFAVQKEEKKAELAVCAICEVRDECLEFGLREPTAIYGGLLPKERRDLVRNPTTKEARCGSYAGYSAHRHRNEKPCQPCSDANNARTKVLV